MSADRDRGIRRQKQKRAKANKKLTRQQRQQPGAIPPAPAASARQKAA